MSSEALGIWMLSKGLVFGFRGLQGAVAQEKKCQCLLHQLSGDEP